MEYFPAPLEALVEQFARLPGYRRKVRPAAGVSRAGPAGGGRRRPLPTPSWPPRKPSPAARCASNFTAGGLCPICASPKRDGSVICVVADPRDVAAMERAREFNGHYHVLHGVISPHEPRRPG